jgi:hypothetical protein
VPDSVESLGDIQEGCGEVLLGFKCFVDFVHYTVFGVLSNVAGESRTDGLVFNNWEEAA